MSSGVAAQSPDGILKMLATHTGDHDLPLHRRINHILSDLIKQGELRPGTMLPPEVELARALGVSRHTMRASLDALVREGLIERRRGKGTVVLRPRIEQSLTHFYSTAQEMRQRGARLRTRVLERGHLYPGEDVAALASDCLGLASPEYGGYIVRVRLVEDEPLLIETLTFPLDIAGWLIQPPAPSLPDPAEESYYDLLIERHGLHVTHARETFRPDVVTGREAELLDVADGSSVFVIERASYAGERCVEWRQTIARGDRYAFVVDLVNPAEDVSS